MGRGAVDRMLQEAAEHYNAGRPSDAGGLCNDILHAEPQYLPALHLSAVLALAGGRMAEGIELLGRVFALDPDHGPALDTLGDALAVQNKHDGALAAFVRAAALRPRDARLHTKVGTELVALSRFAEAESAYRHALSLSPNMTRARFNLAVALAEQGKHDDAEQAYRAVVASDPAYPGAWVALGRVLNAQDKLDEAIAAYLNGLGLAPHDAGLHTAIGAVLVKQGQGDDAITHFRRAVALAPRDTTAMRLLAASLHDADRLEEAAEAFSQAAALDPSDVIALSNLGACLCRLGHLDEATRACERALALKPDHAPAHTNLGIICDERGDVDGAVAAHRRAVAADPTYARGHANLAIVLGNAGELDEALALSHQAVALAPDNALTRSNHAHFLLMSGDLINGFAEYGWGRQCKELAEGMPRFDAPEWQGEPLHGRTLLLYADYGIGDALQFVRYLPMVAARGGTVVLQVQPAIASLLRPLRSVTVVARGEPLPPFDVALPLMELPRIFATTLETIPANIPYLPTDPVKVAAWRSELGKISALKVGVVWAGNPKHKGDARRSLSAEAVLPRLVTPGVQLFSLQKEPRPADAALMASLGSAVIDLAPALGDFSDTAAAVSVLDLVISVDTSTAHLAGALGRPVWMLLPYALDWRWLRDRADTPWYPTMRLIRQERPRAWDGVLTRAAADLARVAGGEHALLGSASLRV